MPLDTPFRLGTFIVDAHGRLEPGNPGQFPSFHLAWRGCPVHVKLNSGTTADGNSAAQLALSAVVGRVPSTAGGDAARNRDRRRLTFGALQGLDAGASPVAQLRLLPDHRMAVEQRRKVELPVSAGNLLTQIACFLLDLGPYLDLLAEADVPVEAVGPASAGNAGTAKIWPG